MKKIATTQDLEQRAAERDALPHSFPVVEFKLLEDTDEPGTYEAIVAVFDNIDDYGDRMRAGSFTDTLKPPPAGRGFPPVVWSHDYYEPPIGVSLEAREVTGEEADELAGRKLGIAGGLYKKDRLLVGEGEDHPTARKILAGMRAKGGDNRPPLREFSFSFRTRQSQWVEEDVEEVPESARWGGEIRDILKVDLYETGPCLVGANPATELLATKSAVRILERRGVISSDEARSMLSNDEGDNPEPNAPKAAASGPEAEEVQARIAEIEQYAPPDTL